MKKKTEISEGFEREEQKEREAFLKLSDEERFIRTCEISEIMLQIQYKKRGFTRRR
jgi:hypothetical protein